MAPPNQMQSWWFCARSCFHSVFRPFKRLFCSKHIIASYFFSLYYNIFLSNSYFALNISYICISTVRAANFQTIFPGHTITLGQRIAPKAVFHPDLWPRYFTKRSPSVFVTPANWTICCRILPPSLANLTIFVFSFSCLELNNTSKALKSCFIFFIL